MKATHRAKWVTCCVWGIAFLALPILGGSCDHGDSSNNALDIVSLVFEIVLGILRATL